MPVLDSVLLYLHIFSAVGWLGAAMVFGMLLGPNLAKFTPQTRGEFVVKIFPKYVKYAESFAVMTVVFGAAAALVMTNGNMGAFAPTTPFGLFISMGALLALVALAIAFLFIEPNVHKVVRLTEELAKNPGPPSPELLKASGNVRKGATIALVVLIVVLLFMVAAATL